MKQNQENLAKQAPSPVVYSRHNTLARPSQTSSKGLFRRDKKQGPTRKQIQEFLGQCINALSENEARMLGGVFRLPETSAREVMTPLSEMFAVPVGTRIDQVKRMIRELDYSHIPVYEERIDRLTGIVSVLDMLYAKDDTDDVGTLIRSAYYIPETKIVGELLEELRSAEDPIALVIDEHGGCVGLVTLEDIFEEIVGEIGPFESGPSYTLEATSSSSWVVDARTDIGTVSKGVGVDIPRDRCDTIGGFVMKLLGRLPEQGDEAEYGGLTFSVAAVFDYGISELNISRAEKQGDRRRKR